MAGLLPVLTVFSTYNQTCPRFIPVRTVGSVGIYSKIKIKLVSNRTQISQGCRSKTGNFGVLCFFMKIMLFLYKGIKYRKITVSFKKKPHRVGFIRYNEEAMLPV